MTRCLALDGGCGCFYDRARAAVQHMPCITRPTEDSVQADDVVKSALLNFVEYFRQAAACVLVQRQVWNEGTFPLFTKRTSMLSTLFCVLARVDARNYVRDGGGWDGRAGGAFTAV